MLWFWIVLRWIVIALVTFLVAGAALSSLTVALLHHGRHLHVWMVWAIIAVSFLIVWTVSECAMRWSMRK